MTPTVNALIARLWCLHWPGPRMPEETSTELRATAVVLDTCLRQLAFGLALPDWTSGVDRALAELLEH